MLIDAGPTYYDGSRMDYMTAKDYPDLTQQAKTRLHCDECKERYRQQIRKLNQRIDELETEVKKSNNPIHPTT